MGAKQNTGADVPKLAVLSHILSGLPTGQSAVLHRMLRALNPEDYHLILEQDSSISAHFHRAMPQFSARNERAVSRRQAQAFDLPGILAVRRLANKAICFGLLHTLGPKSVALYQRSKTAIHIVRREKCRAIIACTADLYDLPAGYIASRWNRIPLYVYIFDDYACQWVDPDHRAFAERIAPIVLRGAVGIIVPNEFLRDEYHRRYGVESLVIHNSCESIELDTTVPWPAEPGKIKIVYTGAIYHAHYDAFRNLLAAMKLLGHPNIELHLYTAQPVTQLEQEQISGPVVYHPYLTSSRIREVQCCADILFLPLAFNSPYPEVIRTAAPGKMGEYLASGRPILAHVPGDSFVSWYFKTYEVGKVVDRADPTALEQAIRQILDEPALRQTWHENALLRAQTDFNLALAQARFLELLHVKGGK